MSGGKSQSLAYSGLLADQMAVSASPHVPFFVLDFVRSWQGLEKAAQLVANRAVFGVPLEESLDVIQIASLPAVVFRCIQYLEATRADQEEGIYRMSGSSAVIKNLKDRFNMGKFVAHVRRRASKWRGRG
jgi:hypothetical protein